MAGRAKLIGQKERSFPPLPGWSHSHFEDVSPIRNVLAGGGQLELSIAVDVIPLGNVSDIPAVSYQQQQMASDPKPTGFN